MDDLVGHARDALKQVYDPETGLNIVDMGLVYDIVEVSDGIAVTMTFTTEGCPAGPYLVDQIESTLRALQGVNSVTVEVTFDPPWTPEMITADGRTWLSI